MTPTHPENFEGGSALPIDDDFVNEVLNDEFGIPDGIEDVAPKVEIARRIHDMVLTLDRDTDEFEEKFTDFVTGLLDLRTNEHGERDEKRTLYVFVRLSRIIEFLLSCCREMCCDEDDEDRLGAREFDDELRGTFDDAVQAISDRQFDEYWDRTQARVSDEGADRSEEVSHLRTFRFSFSYDADCESADLALIELAEVVAHMLEPDSAAPAWSMREFDDVVPLEETSEVLSHRTVRLAANSARLKGFLGLMEQTEFVYESRDN